MRVALIEWALKCTLISAHSAANRLEVTTSPSKKAIGKRSQPFNCNSLAACWGRAQRNVFDPAQMHLVHHLRHDAGMGLLVRYYHHGVVGPLRMHPLDQRADVAQLHPMLVHPDVTVFPHRD